MGWERLRGHATIVERFQSAFARGRLAHAYLLVGPPGVGKQLFARELAAALLCEKPPKALASCGRCAGCKFVAAETHPDFLVLRKPEDKHELPVGEMQEFLKSMGLKSARGEWKVGFVEDAGDFNEESANAFLKTLEEPPSGSLLLLRAASLETQLQTILSRCQPVRFAALKDDDVRAILAEQGVEASRLDDLVKLARGSPGRALALNDPMLGDFRRGLVETLSAPKFNHAAFAERWLKFVEEAGKESAAQRGRAALALHLLIDALQQAVRLALNAGEGAHPLRSFAERVGPEKLLAMLEAAIEADRHVEQRVALPITLELLADRLAA